MTTAPTVPPTYELEGDDARETLRKTGWTKLLGDSVRRFRAGDGTSHARALAFQIVLASFPGLIAFVGFATYFDKPGLRKVFEQTAATLAPGPAGQIFHQAFHQGANDARSSGLTALIFGLIAALTAATSGMAEIERGANRIYGIDKDRPAIKKYTIAFLLAISAGLLTVAAFTLLVAGGAIASSGPSAGWSDALVTAWEVARWPLSVVLTIVAVAIIFRVSPNRRQPQLSWLAVGAGMAVVLWLALTGLLSLYLSASKNFGQTYGPIAGILGLLLWSLLSSFALFLGISFAAQLEAVRVGVPSLDRGRS